MWWSKKPNAVRNLMKTNMDDLRREKIRLDLSLKQKRNELEKLENTRKDIFFKGARADKLNRMTIARELQVIDNRRRNALNDYKQLNMEMILTENFMYLKERLSKGRDQSLVQKIAGKDISEVADMMRTGQIEDLLDRDKLKDIMNVLDQANVDADTEEQEMTNNYLDAWKQMDTADDPEEQIKLGENFLSEEPQKE